MTATTIALTASAALLLVFLAAWLGWHLYRYCQVWTWTTKLAVKYRLFDSRRRARARVNVEVGHLGDPPDRGWCIPRGVARAGDGRLIPRTLHLRTGLGIEDTDLAKFLRAHHFHTGEVWTHEQLIGTRWMLLELAKPLPTTPPAAPVTDPSDRPTLVPLGAGRTSPLAWDVGADDPLAARSPDTLAACCLVVALQGWGKSVLVQQVLDFCHATDGAWRTLVIDPEGEHDGGARTVGQRLQLLRQLVADMDAMTRKHETGEATYPQQIAAGGRTMLVIDEFPEVMDPPRRTDPDYTQRLEIIRLVEDVARRGRKRGVALFAVGTEFRVNTLGPVRDLFGLVVAGWLGGNAHKAMFGRQPPHRQPRRVGLAWMQTATDLVEIQTYARPPAQPAPLRRVS